MESCLKYSLRQISQNTQDLTFLSGAPRSSYTIKSSQTGGFMNRKPHMVISKHEIDDARPRIVVAEVRFEINGTGTNIIYKDSGAVQALTLVSSLDQKYECSILGQTHRWQPSDLSRTVLELFDAASRRVAMFTYAGEVSRTTGVGTGRNSRKAGEDIGQMHILEEVDGGPRAVEEVVCSALAIVERTKRRAMNVGKQGSAYKQGVSCGITTNAYGGGL